jgi:hypothetical protein
METTFPIGGLSGPAGLCRYVFPYTKRFLLLEKTVRPVLQQYFPGLQIKLEC